MFYAKSLLAALALLGFSRIVWSQAIPAASTTAAQVQEFENPVTELKKTVVFLRMVCTDGNQVYTSEGTGFLVAVQSPDKSAFTSYLVTNRHVAYPARAGVRLNVTAAFVRVNLRRGGSTDIPLPLLPKWLTSADASVDLAVLPFLPPPDIVDFKAIPLSDLIDREQMRQSGLAEAQHILFAGFFKQYPGEARMEPIVRQGIIAMLPDEKIPEEGGYQADLYLADTHSFHGNSGSPVFTDVGSGFQRQGLMIGAPRYVVIGVINGFFSEEAPLRAVPSSTLEGVAESNSGIATIVPAGEILDILNMDSVKAKREADWKSFSQVSAH
jgi:hypothetical protein